MPDINLNIDSTYGVIIIQDLKAVFVDENYANIYGYQSPDELINSIDSFLELIQPDLRDTAKQNYYDLIAGNMLPHGHTFTNIDRHGKEFTVFSVDHVIEWQGKPALQVTVIDLSIVVEANKKIRERDLMFRQLIMNSGQGILIHRDFKPLLLNKAWLKVMHAESAEQVMELGSILKIIPIEQHKAAFERYHNTINGIASDKSNVVENITFDGSKRFFNVYDNLIEWEGEPAVQVVIEDVTEKVTLEQELAYRATHDQLTDLFNRGAIYDWLDEHFKIDTELVCLLMDLDDFKRVNDTYGHHVGDDVIKALSVVIKDEVQQNNGVVGRWGGEEFIAFVPNISCKQAVEIAESIRLNFNEIEYQNETYSFHSSVSIGVSCSTEYTDFTSVDDLIKIADKSLYIAKASGKNLVMNCLEND
jgi:diguanylate cyclase (GGDEF)-like protein/PAS domain S-box-containing protein